LGALVTTRPHRHVRHNHQLRQEGKPPMHPVHKDDKLVRKLLDRFQDIRQLQGPTADYLDKYNQQMSEVVQQECAECGIDYVPGKWIFQPM
jgi:hypothetical protein